MYIKNIFKSIILLSILFFNLAIAQNIVLNSDKNITEAVENKVRQDTALSNTVIYIKTYKGVVALSGVVDSNTQVDIATELAQSVPGVKDVDASRLEVKGGTHPMADTLITAKIKGLYIQHKLFSDKDIAAMSISVETNGGVVTLRGTVDNPQQAENAIKIARSVSGVKQVKSSIKIAH